MENRLINYWKDGKWFLGTEETDTLTDIAEPEQAQTALEESSDAFTLESVETEPETITDVVDQEFSNQYSEELNQYGFGSGQLSDIQKLINYMPTTTEAEVIAKQNAQKALQNLSSSGVSYYENPYYDKSASELITEYETALGKSDSEYAIQKSLLEQDIEAQNASDTLNFKLAKEGAESAASAVKAGVGAVSREGVTSATNPLVSSEYSSRVQEKIQVAKQQLNNAITQRAELLRKLDEAKNNQDEDLQKSLSAELADVGKEIADIQSEQELESANRVTEALDILGQFEIGGLANMDINSLTEFLGDGVLASQLINLDKAREAGRISDREYQAKVESAKTSSLPQSAKEFMYYQELYKTDPVSAQKYAVQVGIEKSPAVEQWSTEELKKTESGIDFYNENNIAVPVNSKYDFVVSGDSVTWNVQTGLPPTIAGRDECGEFVNDALGKPHYFKNSLREKIEVTNSDKPVAGGAVVFNTGDWTGHVGLVEQVFADGYTVRDSNRIKNEKGQGVVDTMFIPFGSKWDNMADGFYNPYQGEGGELSETAKQVIDNPSLLGNYTSTKKGEILTELANSGIDLKEVATPEQVKLLNSMNDDIRSEPLYKQVIEIQNGFQNVTIGANMSNAQGDLAIVNGYAKMLDPTGVVRPAEFKTVEEAQGFFERFKTLPKKYIEGDRLHPDARKKFSDAAKILFNEKTKSFNSLIDNKYKKTAEYSGIPVELIENLKVKDVNEKEPDIEIIKTQFPDKILVKDENGEIQMLDSEQDILPTDTRL